MLTKVCLFAIPPCWLWPPLSVWAWATAWATVILWNWIHHDSTFRDVLRNIGAYNGPYIRYNFGDDLRIQTGNHRTSLYTFTSLSASWVSIPIRIVVINMLRCFRLVVSYNRMVYIISLLQHAKIMTQHEGTCIIGWNSPICNRAFHVSKWAHLKLARHKYFESFC